MRKYKHRYYDVDADGNETDLIGVTLFKIETEEHDYCYGIGKE